MSKSETHLSIVTTLFCSAPYIQEFYDRARKAAETTTKNYEIVFVNDDSPDDTLARAVSIQQKDPRVVVIDLSRNFGHHQAIMTGLSYAQGEIIFLIDGDLEEDPEWLLAFHVVLQQQKCDVVYGIQQQRKGRFFERFSGALFYRFFNFLSSTPIPSSAVIARLMSRRYVQNLLRHQEREIFIPALWQLTGFHQTAVPVAKRSKKTTTYTLRRKIALFVNAVTSFSDKPLVYIFYTGTLLCTTSGAYVLWLLYRKCRWGIPLLGWPSLIVSIWLLGGLTIFFIGILGIYLAKVYREVKQRPSTIIRDVFRTAKPDAGID